MDIETSELHSTCAVTYDENNKKQNGRLTVVPYPGNLTLKLQDQFSSLQNLILEQTYFSDTSQINFK